MKEVSFTSGQGVGTLVTISILIIDDNIIESMETFSGILSVTVGERIYLSPNKMEVFIIDNDGKY